MALEEAIDRFDDNALKQLFDIIEKEKKLRGLWKFPESIKVSMT